MKGSHWELERHKTVVSRDRWREIERKRGEKEREAGLPRWLAMQFSII